MRRRRLRVVCAAPDPRHPGGINAVLDSWRQAGLEREVEVIHLRTSAWDSPVPLQVAQAARALLRLLWILARPRARRPDVVHLHASVGGSLYRKLALSLCCRLARTPYVAQMHSGSFEPWLRASRINRGAARVWFSGSAVAIVLGERWRRTAAALGAGRVEVLPNGIPEGERLRLSRVAARRAARDRSAPTPVMLFYGRWAPVKGADRLAAALRALDRDDYEVHLYGNGDREWLTDAFAGVRGRVEIGGWLQGEEKLAELAGAAAVLAPSRAEGFPTALVEARAASVPILATEVGAVAEALAGYRPARLLPPGDDPALRDAIAALLEGSWPPRQPGSGAEPVALPPSLRSESAVERLLQIYATATG